MSGVIVDTNIVLDIFTQDSIWFNWSNEVLEKAMETGRDMVINSIIYAELSIGFPSAVELDKALSVFNFRYEDPSKLALFSAGKAFIKYRASKGTKNSVLPDFIIGGHAEAMQYQIMTRDSGRYSAYFPKIKLIAPK
jgi:predicted nucleic acid-binding protein